MKKKNVGIMVFVAVVLGIVGTVVGILKQGARRKYVVYHEM